MTDWTRDEPNKIKKTDELEIASLRNDGTLRKPVIIWVVRVGDALYVRSVKGHAGGWFPGALSQHAGRIQAGGVEKDVSFVEENDPRLNEQINAAYQAKYRCYPSSVSHINSPEARAALIILMI